MVVGIAASGRTPFVIGGLESVKELGCTTAAVACNKGSAIGKIADIAIDEADGSGKLAIIKILTGTDMETAKRLLEEAKGHVRGAICLAQNK